VNDLKDLLELALSDAPGPAERADPAGDLARGRRLLRRRRLTALAGVTAAVLCGVLVPLTLEGSGPSAANHPAAAASSNAQSSHAQPSHPRSGTPTPDNQSPQIKLVAWVGTQPPGYRVSWMPKGWVVQGSTPYALVMAPPNAADKDPDVYIRKLVVMLQSRDATAPPAEWASQSVNGRPGKFDVQGDTQILTFQIAGGRWVVVQAPVSLGWDRAELAKFASGVQVLVTAQQGSG
jgi:hypothetical protein